LHQSLLAADQPLLTHEAEPDRELSTAFELLRISDGRDYGACRSRPKARDTLQVTACLNPMPCQQFYVDILDPFGVAAPQGPVFADLLCRFKKSKQPFNITEALLNYDVQYGERRANNADDAAP
jgi:hypothetical protein